MYVSGLNQLIKKLDKRLSSKKDKRNSFSAKPRVEGAHSTSPPPKSAPKFAVKPDVWEQLHPPEESTCSNPSTPPHAHASPISDPTISTPLTHLSQYLSPCNPAMYSFSNGSLDHGCIGHNSPASSIDYDSPVSSPLALFN